MTMLVLTEVGNRRTPKMGKLSFPLAGAMEKDMLCTLTALNLIAWPARASLMTRHVPACCLGSKSNSMKLRSTAQHERP